MSHMGTSVHVLVLGFYARKNAGDDCYEFALQRLIGDMHLNASLNIDFKCTDDINVLPEGVDIVICGGGDIVNQYFMSKVEKLISGYTGMVYAVSVGIPYKCDANYLQMFDHVFVRSSPDYEVAVKEVGEKNVSLCGDISLALYNGLGPPKITPVQDQTSRPKVHVGVCLAQPAFYDNSFKSFLMNKLQRALVELYHEHDGMIQYHLLPFNTNTDNMSECDIYIHQELQAALLDQSVDVVNHESLNGPLELLAFINNHTDYMVCMRYHSVMFSIICSKPFATLHSTQKIDSLLKDANCNERACRLICDDFDVPYDFNEHAFKENISRMMETATFYHMYSAYINTKWPTIQNMMQDIFVTKKMKVPIHRSIIPTFEHVLECCHEKLPDYLSISTEDYERLLPLRQPLPIGAKNKTDVARFICFLIVGKTHHPTLWGLMDNLTHPDFCLYEAIEYIWKDLIASASKDTNIQHLPSLPRSFQEHRCFADINNIFNHDFADVHRAGWNFVVNGLMSIDSSQYMRGKGDVLIDTYVDRSFHWGLDTLHTLKIVPYTKPWIGFVHHTFDITHSAYNCEELFANDMFIESLPLCKALIALSANLAAKLKFRLLQIGFDIPVHDLCHPMLFVDKMFTPEKFLSNPRKAVVQIGAWLRSPYSIYKLKVDKYEKIALRGNEMDLYFAPPDYLSTMASVLLKQRNGGDAQPSHTVMCRSSMCRDSTTNKFCAGVYEMLESQYQSVHVCDRLTNDEYDELLSSNIVFLHLVDCSAVNTVIECIVRNTPIVVNRLPALEEVLGPHYPGFYDTLEQAATICEDDNMMYAMYSYLTGLNKSKYTLDYFLNDIHTILCDKVTVSSGPVTFNRPSSLMSRIPMLSKYLPTRFVALL